MPPYEKVTRAKEGVGQRGGQGEGLEEGVERLLEDRPESRYTSRRGLGLGWKLHTTSVTLYPHDRNITPTHSHLPP